MTTAVMFMTLANATGAVLTDASVKQGKFNGLKVIQRTLSAIDVGAEAGKTEHAQGALCFTPSGCVVKGIVSVTAMAANAGTMKSPLQVCAHVRADGSIAIRDVIPGGGAAVLAAGDVVTITFVTGPVTNG